MSESIHGNKCKSDKINDFTDSSNYPFPDLTYLKDIAEGDEAFIKEIISYFVEFGPGLLRSMKESALSGEREKLRFSAHTLLPQLTFVGILAAIPDVEKIERESKLNDDLFVELERAIKIVNCGIEDLKKLI